MLFKIKDIGDDGVDVDLPVTAAWLAAECPDLDVRPAAGGLALRGTLEKSGDDFLLRGDLSGALETPCARCLETARITLDVPLAVTFVERGDAGADDEDDDGDVVFFEGGEIDLGEELHDEILLAIPINPLCDDACRGLCPVCGGNRNAKACDCEEKQRQATSKLSALGKIEL
jgi:uncharacterized metal-binding protein YceD (DUF177 family)